jgi:hypothetical protein
MIYEKSVPIPVWKQQKNSYFIVTLKMNTYIQIVQCTLVM